MFTGPLFEIKLHLLSTVLLSGFHSSPELSNPLSRAVHVPGEFHGSGGYSKCKYLQDRVNFHRIRVWQIVLIFNTAISPFHHICPNYNVFVFVKMKQASNDEPLELQKVTYNKVSHHEIYHVLHFSWKVCYTYLVTYEWNKLQRCIIRHCISNYGN